jgi:hypothetical protein
MGRHKDANITSLRIYIIKTLFVKIFAVTGVSIGSDS